MAGMRQRGAARLRAARERRTATPTEHAGPPAVPPARPVLAPPIRCSAGATLTEPDRQDELERFGFTVVPLLDGPQLAAIRTMSEAMGPAPDDPQVALNWSFHSRSQDYKQAVKQLLPSARAALDEVLVDHEVYLTTFITKWPGPHSGFPPHQDPSLVDERRFTGVNVWVPLVDVGADNGMLHVVPGSHRFSSTLRVQNVDHSPYAGLEEAIVGRHGRGVPVRAGDALVFDNRIIHYSLPNASDEPRVVLSFGLRPRVGRCVVVLPVEAGGLEMFEVDDDFYIDVVPAQRDRWTPAGPPLTHVVNPTEAWDEDDLAALCAAVGPAPWTVAATPPEDLAAALDTGVFCSLCGTSEGLSEADRAGQTNAQLLCPRCVDLLATEAEGASRP